MDFNYHRKHVYRINVLLVLNAAHICASVCIQHLGQTFEWRPRSSHSP